MVYQGPNDASYLPLALGSQAHSTSVMVLGIRPQEEAKSLPSRLEEEWARTTGTVQPPPMGPGQSPVSMWFLIHSKKLLRQHPLQCCKGKTGKHLAERSRWGFQTIVPKIPKIEQWSYRCWVLDGPEGPEPTLTNSPIRSWIASHQIQYILVRKSFLLYTSPQAIKER